MADLPPQQQGGGSADDKCVARALARIAREMYAGSIDALMGIVASIEKRIEAAAVRAQPVRRWGRVIIDDPDPDARIAEHQQPTDGAPCIYRIIGA